MRERKNDRRKLGHTWAKEKVMFGEKARIWANWNKRFLVVVESRLDTGVTAQNHPWVLQINKHYHLLLNTPAGTVVAKDTDTVRTINERIKALPTGAHMGPFKRISDAIAIVRLVVPAVTENKL